LRRALGRSHRFGSRASPPPPPPDRVACRRRAGPGPAARRLRWRQRLDQRRGDAAEDRRRPIELTDQYGKKVDLAKLKGHSVLVAFLYTHCTDLCPIVAGKLHTAYAHLKKSERPLFLAVSVDPAHDTPASAATFNKRHRTEGEIDWLLGSQPELEKVWKAWGVKPEHNANDPEEIEHNAEIFAIDKQGQIRALYPPNFKAAKLAEGTKTLAQL
jgi:cytochrome oxidase Cu insertion factor (SCO1/SenC/PrrC family)